MTYALPLGLTGNAERLVTPQNTAQALSSGLVPVFGTPALVGLLEEAAVNAVAATLAPTDTSVGVHVDVRHLAATPLGMVVRATATLTAVEGRRLTFQVEARDDVDLVAEGTHQRVVVDRTRFMARAEGKRS